MKIITKNKKIISKLGKNEITYIFNKNDNIEELIEISKKCKVKRYIDSYELFDISIDCEDCQSRSYKSSKEKISDILKEEKKINYKLSIIMPNYNYSEWLEKSIGSILKQTYTNYEIIFIDDMSEDNSVDIAKRLLRDKDILVELKTKRLNGGARNEGLIRATGDYIVFLDSDDWFYSKTTLNDINNGLYGQDVMFCDVMRYLDGKPEKSWISRYADKYEAMASGHSGSCFKVIKRDLALRCMFNEGTLQEDRNHHSKICYYMKTFNHIGKITHIWNRDNTKSICKVRDKALWGTCVYRNYADCKQFLMEIEEDGDKKAIGILKDRLIRINQDIEYGRDVQH